MRRFAFLPLLVVVAAPAFAQAPTQAPAPMHASASPSSALADVRAHWRTLSGFVLRSAKAVPETRYAYRPTDGVRSFAELFVHVAGAQSMFCAMTLGEKPPAEDAVKATSKAEIIAALEHSNADCERAYAQSDFDAAATIDVFGAPHSRLYALVMNATHDAEHYGNIVTYMRLTGMVPPSSQPAP